MSFILAASLAQAPVTPTDCAVALARSSSTATAQICLGEDQVAAAQLAPKASADWRGHLEAAAASYRRALALTPDETIKTIIIERLLTIYDEPLLNNPDEMESALRDLMTVKPREVSPLLRLAAFQERHGSFDAAEDTLLSARRLQSQDVEPIRMLAQFYARRASALHAQAVKDQPVEAAPAGAPDNNGVYHVGGGVTPPRRLGNAPYPVEAQAAGIQGAVVAEVTVNEAGIVTDARVLESIPVLDDAALKAVREWRYDPTIVNGRPVPIKMRVTVNFTLAR